MEKIQRLARHKRELVFSALIFFACSVSFAAGFAASGGFGSSPIVIEECAALHGGPKENPR